MDGSRLGELVSARRKELVELLGSLVRIPSDNPPGDTRALSAFIEQHLEKAGISSRIFEPREGNTNLVATIGSGSPHLVLNGHLDQFTAEVGEPWKHPPHGAAVVDGKLYGRGSGDMKAGLASLIHVFTAATEADLPGMLTLTCTSDEETGGEWGARWLLDNVPGVKGDAVLNGEPSGLTVRIGEKSMLPLLVKTRGKPAHGSFAGYAGENAIEKMAKLIPEIVAFRSVVAEPTPEIREVFAEITEGYTAQFGHEARNLSEVLRRVTVNVGVIRGGAKSNIVPAECEAEVDLRLPLGLEPEPVKKMISDRLGELDASSSVEYARSEGAITGPTYTSPRDRIVGILRENSRRVNCVRPFLSFTSGGTDCRFWRLRGVPAVSYGPRVFGMGAADEHVLLEDLYRVAEVHAGVVSDYLA